MEENYLAGNPIGSNKIEHSSEHVQVDLKNSLDITEGDVLIPHQSDRRRGSDTPQQEYDVLNKAQGTATTKSAVFNLVNTIIGGGVLALPFAFKQSGIVLGCLLLVLVAMLTGYSAYILIITTVELRLKVPSYERVAAECFGDKVGKLLIEISSQLFLLGACTGYIVIIGDVMVPFVKDWTSTDVSPWIVQLIFVILIIYPLCCLPKIDALKYTSMIASILITYLILSIVIRSSTGISEAISNEDNYLRYFELRKEIFIALPLITFAFSFHVQLFPIWRELKDSSRENANRIVGTSLLVCCVAYLLVGIFGYLTFFETTLENVLVNFEDDPLIEVGKLGLAIIISFSFPLMNFPLRAALDLMIFPRRQPSSLFRGIIESTFILTVAFILAISVDNISTVFSFVGSTVGNMLIFIFPPICYMIVGARQRAHSEHRNEIRFEDFIYPNPLTNVFPLLLAICGFLFMIGGLYSIILDKAE